MEHKDKPMDTTKPIKLFVILELLLLVAYVVTSLAMEPHLPPSLQAYLAEELNSEIDTADQVLLWVGIPIIIIYAASVIGLLRTKVWAKNTYASASVLAISLYPLLPPMVEHAFAAALYEIGALTNGAILALLFFTKSAFSRKNQQEASGEAP